MGGADVADSDGRVEAVAHPREDIRQSTVRVDESVEVRPRKFQLAVVDDTGTTSGQT